MTERFKFVSFRHSNLKMVRLTQKKIEGLIMGILGEEGLRLTKQLQGNDNISEFTLATKLRRDIKLVRKMLYHLYNNNLVSFTRKKDKQKGWYIYYWTFVPESLKFLYIKNKKERLARFKEQLAREEAEQFFSCPKNCVRLDFDQAMDFEFRCPECGELIIQDMDKDNTVSELNKWITRLEKELAEEKNQSIARAAKERIKIAKLDKIIEEKLAKQKIVKKKVVKKKIVKKKAIKTKKLSGKSSEKVMNSSKKVNKKISKKVIKKIKKKK